MTSVAQALAEAGRAGLDRLDAHLLLARLLGQTRTWLIAHDDAPVAAEPLAQFRAGVTRRAAGEPLAYLLGEKEFHGLLLAVDARVLVPRPDTEVLVDWAIEHLAGLAEPSQAAVLDLGTGSGAVALAVAHAVPGARVVGTDISRGALEVARSNAYRLGLTVEFAEGSWWSAVAGRHFDLALSNPPYIAAGDAHLAALSHEPAGALTPGGDGLDSLRAIVAGAADRLRAGAWLLLEHGHDQQAPVTALLRQAGFTDVQTRADVAGRPRCSGGRRGITATKLSKYG